MTENGLYIGCQWRNFFIPIYASCSSRHDVGQGNVNILQYLQSDRRSGDSTKLFLLNLLIRFYLIKVINFRLLRNRSPQTWRTCRDRRLLWRHFTLCIVRVVCTAVQCEIADAVTSCCQWQQKAAPVQCIYFSSTSSFSVTWWKRLISKNATEIMASSIGKPLTFVYIRDLLSSR